MVFLLLVVFGFSTKPLTMIRLFAELSGHYLPQQSRALFCSYTHEIFVRAPEDSSAQTAGRERFPRERKPSQPFTKWPALLSPRQPRKKIRPEPGVVVALIPPSLAEKTSSEFYRRRRNRFGCRF
jgi:hypothetical protein